jgi:cell envelope opacity-associated protein A
MGLLSGRDVFSSLSNLNYGDVVVVALDNEITVQELNLHGGIAEFLK